MSHHVVASIECDKDGFPCGTRVKIPLGMSVAEARASLKAKGWQVNKRVNLTSGRAVRNDYCPDHKVD